MVGSKLIRRNYTLRNLHLKAGKKWGWVGGVEWEGKYSEVNCLEPHRESVAFPAPRSDLHKAMLLPHSQPISPEKTSENQHLLP